MPPASESGLDISWRAVGRSSSQRRLDEWWCASLCSLLLPLLHRFQFEPDALEVVVAGKEEESTENKFVGGRNRCVCVAEPRSG